MKKLDNQPISSVSKTNWIVDPIFSLILILWWTVPVSFGADPASGLAIGDLVWRDLDGNGRWDSGEPGIRGVNLVLFDSSGRFIAGSLTDDSGHYQFTGLPPGVYFVTVDRFNFAVGQPLEGLVSSPGAPNADNDVDNDDNGQDNAFPVVDGVASTLIMLGSGTEPDVPVDGDGPNGNQTLDFGFTQISNPQPGSSVSISAPSIDFASVSPVTYTVTYDNIDISSVALTPAYVLLNRSGTANGIVSVAGAGFVRTVTISAISGDGTLGISIAPGTAMDLSGNPAPAAGPSTTFTVDNSAPTVNLSAPSSGSATTGPVAYTVTYADANFSASTLTMGDVGLNSTGTADGLVSVTGSGTIYSVTILSITGTGTLGISIAPGTAIDLAGNAAPAAVSAVFAVDNAHAVNSPPIISAIPSQTATMGTTVGPLSFTIGDAETAPQNLLVSARSFNEFLVPNGNIVVGGTGADRTLTIKPAAGQIGMAFIEVRVSDGMFDSVAAFNITWVSGSEPNTAPTISGIADQFINQDTSTAALIFTIGDAETPPEALILSASSSNTTLVPNANILFGGSGSNRTMIITPEPNQFGMTSIAVTVADEGGLSAVTVFDLTVTPSPVNTPPLVSPIPDQTVTDMTLLQLLVFATDSDLPPNNLTFALGTAPIGMSISPLTGQIVFTPNGTQGGQSFAVVVRVTDDGSPPLSAATSFIVTVLPSNAPPSLGVSQTAITVDEGSSASNQGMWSDADGDDVILSASLGTITRNNGSWTWQYSSPDGPFAANVVIIADDRRGGIASTSFTLEVNNIAPTVTIFSPSSGLVRPVNSGVSFAGSFTDPGILDTQTAVWTFTTAGVPDRIVPATLNGHSISDTFQFSDPGVYFSKLTVMDKDGGTGQATKVNGTEAAHCVIFDPNGGFVTGGGWFESPQGALFLAPTTAGKAIFGFNAKYAGKNTTIPQGNLEFDFQSGGLNFKSRSLEWLVVLGGRAQFKGSGTINRKGDFAVLLTAVDGDLPGGHGDRIRVQIWDQATGLVVYDNQPGSPSHAALDDSTIISNGSIVIHKGK